jgi:AcrR family transcriptional regulator
MKTQGSRGRGRGRPPGGDSGAREAILVEARRQFSELGFGRTTLRGIARRAGVDPRLVLHYFGSKQDLFLASVELPMDPDVVVATVFGGDPASVPERAARLMVSVVDDPGSRRPLLALLRAAVTEPEAAELVQRLLTERMLLPVAERVGGDRPGLRASMMASSLVGLVIVRHVVGMAPLAEATREDLVRALVPVFEHYLRGEWVSG